MKCTKCNSRLKAIDFESETTDKNDVFIYECVKCSHQFVVCKSNPDDGKKKLRKVSFSIKSHLFYLVLITILALKINDTENVIIGLALCLLFILFFIYEYYLYEDFEVLKTDIDHTELKKPKKSNLSRKARKAKKTNSHINKI